jgi:hypothetical protein
VARPASARRMTRVVAHMHRSSGNARAEPGRGGTATTVSESPRIDLTVRLPQRSEAITVCWRGAGGGVRMVPSGS